MLDARYHSLQSTVNRRFANGLFIKGAYTFGKAINMADESATDDGSSNLMWNTLPQFHRNRALAGYDRTHIFNIAWLYELPFGPNRRLFTGGIPAAITRDWQINGQSASYSGTPFSVTSSGASLDAPGDAQTADQLKAEVRTLHGVGAGAPWFDPLAFRSVTEVRYGNTGRNILRGPGAIDLNLGVFRSFQFNERVRLQFRAEAFHATNSPIFVNPGTSVSSMQLNSDGTIRNLNGFSEIRTASGERQFRFGLRLNW